jgi:hypothetical protein
MASWIVVSLLHPAHMRALSSVSASASSQSSIQLTLHFSHCMSRKSNAIAPGAPPPPEVLLLGCEGVGKSCLARQMKWKEGEEEPSLAAAPTVRRTLGKCKEEESVSLCNCRSIPTELTFVFTLICRIFCW